GRGGGGKYPAERVRSEKQFAAPPGSQGQYAYKSRIIPRSLDPMGTDIQLFTSTGPT
ncbi:MAG: hypothetical protein Q9212_006908, partial [Teloschistes hypoglaucus]